MVSWIDGDVGTRIFLGLEPSAVPAIPRRSRTDTHSVVDYLENTEDVEEPVQLSEKLKNKIKQRKKKLLTIRLDEDIIEATKKPAYKKAVSYQTLMRM